MGLDVNEAEGHPSVSGMGAGEADAGCGAGITKAAEIGFNKIQATQLALYILPGIQVLSSDKGTPES